MLYKMKTFYKQKAEGTMKLDKAKRRVGHWLFSFGEQQVYQAHYLTSAIQAISNWLF